MLTPSDLADRLEHEWLQPFADSAPQSGQRFANAVGGWFGSAQAAGFPCITAAPRLPQLAALAAGALEAGVGPTSGALLATAVASYYAGQAFGTGIASFPAALPAGIALMTAALLDLELPRRAKAERMALACHALALSTLVIFPTPLPPAPIT